MKYFSTSGSGTAVSLREAVLGGTASDGGLYVPELIPKLPVAFLSALSSMSLQQIGFEIARSYLTGDLTDQELSRIVERSINFPAPLVKIDDGMHVLELFHGPTFAFKDFGARFMARLTEHFAATLNRPLTILVATSGDTGSAVAHGFLGVKGVNVVILYPSGKVSMLQEKQFTTLGENITALEVNGTFDQCQTLAKDAFRDRALQEKLHLSSANSINIARLIPQTFYYFATYAQLANKSDSLYVSVPSGNFGNLTAGIMAKKMGLPITQFIAATNANSVVPDYLAGAAFEPRPSLRTISNAMDVGNPSNFSRLLWLYKNSREEMCRDICGFSFSDQATERTISATWKQTGYLLDPHGAVALLGACEHKRSIPGKSTHVLLATAHPAKFGEVLTPLVGDGAIKMPATLAAAMQKEKKTVYIEPALTDLKEILLSL